MHDISPELAIELYNTIPGVRPVSRVPDRTTAQARLRLAMEKAGLRMQRQGGRHVLVPVDARRGTERVIRVLVDHNPKRVGSLSHSRFALYRDGMTMREYVETVGGKYHKAMMDMYTDRDRGYIALEE